MTVDPFGMAIRDQFHGERTEPLVVRDGAETLHHPIEELYFAPFPPGPPDEGAAWLESWLDGPLLDVGAGVGRHARYFQSQFETVAIEVSEYLVETMDDRGVNDARHVDMFDLRAQFERDRFSSVLVIGTQIGLTRSVRGLVDFLDDIAYVTGPDGTIVLDSYDPDAADTTDLLGYRADPTPGLAYRVMTFEYEGNVSETLLFRLFAPDRVAAAAAKSGWRVEERSPGSGAYYRMALSKAETST